MLLRLRRLPIFSKLILIFPCLLLTGGADNEFTCVFGERLRRAMSPQRGLAFVEKAG